MNERIKEILNQPVFNRLKDFYDCGSVHKATIEEFVNAIVGECNKVLKQNWNMGGSSSTIYAIKKHFGVD